MSKEIERKFLVVDDSWKKESVGVLYRQGYLNSSKERTVRVRTIADKGFLTVKGLTLGCTRLELNTKFLMPTQKKCWMSWQRNRSLKNYVM